MKVSIHKETSQLILIAKQLNGFYISPNLQNVFEVLQMEWKLKITNLLKTHARDTKVH